MAALATAAAAQVMAQRTVSADNIGDFDALKLSGKMNVELIAADTTGIALELLDTDTRNLSWGIENGRLSITLRPVKNARADVKVYYKSLDYIAVSDASVTAADTLRSPMLDITAGSAAKVELAAVCSDIAASLSGSASVKLSGSTRYISVTATERSKADTRGMEAQSAEVDASTAAEVSVNATERIAARAKSGSAVFYKGQPTIVRTKASGIGSSINDIGK